MRKDKSALEFSLSMQLINFMGYYRRGGRIWREYALFLRLIGSR